MGILNRLYAIAKSNTLGHVEVLKKAVGRKDGRIGSKTKADDRGSFKNFSGANTGGPNSTDSGPPEDTKDSGIPQQIIEDLATFNLAPPSSMDEVRKARNREIKKYHSDKFMDDPEKLNTSKEIMQIYNAAYDRLRDYYENK